MLDCYLAANWAWMRAGCWVLQMAGMKAAGWVARRAGRWVELMADQKEHY